jgi:AbrB family looped-hinge helix DNA binding protein
LIANAESSDRPAHDPLLCCYTGGEELYMTTKVGPKGQVVIEREIREQLGIHPGMLAVQQVVDDHVEVRFVVGPHRQSLAGAARPFIRRFPSQHELENIDALWAEEVGRHSVSDSSERVIRRNQSPEKARRDGTSRYKRIGPLSDVGSTEARRARKTADRRL